MCLRDIVLSFIIHPRYYDAYRIIVSNVLVRVRFITTSPSHTVLIAGFINIPYALSSGSENKINAMLCQAASYST